MKWFGRIGNSNCMSYYRVWFGWCTLAIRTAFVSIGIKNQFLNEKVVENE